MTKEHEPPFTAGEVIQDMQHKGMIPSGPAPARKHRIMEVVEYGMIGACLGMAAIIGVLIVMEVLGL